MLDKHSQWSSGNVRYTANGPYRHSNGSSSTRLGLGCFIPTLLFVASVIAFILNSGL